MNLKIEKFLLGTSIEFCLNQFFSVERKFRIKKDGTASDLPSDITKLCKRVFALSDRIKAIVVAYDAVSIEFDYLEMPNWEYDHDTGGYELSVFDVDYVPMGITDEVIAQIEIAIYLSINGIFVEDFFKKNTAA